ncbi:MAG: sulfite exporter TauE/SafE family protein [Gemmatimonadetes bacterium]|nr:MAG: sulfite exporter TauE/SafE family protein [Gemmatimonadota bacterium]
MELTQLVIVFVVGIVAGIINTLAGGGSLLTLPTLIFIGLSGATANGTNRIAILVQNIFAVSGFHRKGISDVKRSIQLALPTLMGAMVGAKIGVELPDEWFRKVLAVIMVLVLIITLKKPKIHLKKGSRGWGLTLLIFFFVGIYGGFIQAGVGFFLIMALTVVTGKNLVYVNYYKVFIVGIYTIFALSVFIWEGKIDWLIGSTLALGNGLGGWIGSHSAVALGEKWLRYVLAIAVIAMAINLMWRG